MADSSSFLLPRLAVVALLVFLLCGTAPHCVDGARIIRNDKQLGAGHWGSEGTTGASAATGTGVLPHVERRRTAVVASFTPVPPSGPSKMHH